MRAWGGGSDGRRSRDLTIFSRALYQLSYRAMLRRKLCCRLRDPDGT